MPVVSTHPARLLILQLALPGQDIVNAGVLLEDPISNEAYLRMRRDWGKLAPEEAEVLSQLEADLSSKALAHGASWVIGHLTDTLSNTLLISDAREVVVEDFHRALGRLYREHVHSTIEPFRTHLPRYSLTAAAGKFLENQEVDQEDWEEAPPELRLDDQMFVAKIAGQSMEPRIPDGSLCVFRGGTVAGSRQGRLVLVEALGRGTNDRYTVKRYSSLKRQDPDGTWRHERVRLEPLNPAFEAWDLDPNDDSYRIIAEFVQVLD
jgi:phage repressor protein C with HTH and peptisase S24 domain